MNIGSNAAYTGQLTFDATSLKDVLVDLPPGGTQNLKFEKPGFNAVLDELAVAKSGALASAGIAAEVVTRIEARSATLEEVRKKKAEAEKLAEILRETEAALEDAREGDIALVARGVQTATKHLDPDIAAHFEKTTRYYSQIADKAAATRRKNEVERSAQAPTPAEPSLT